MSLFNKTSPSKHYADLRAVALQNVDADHQRMLERNLRIIDEVRKGNGSKIDAIIAIDNIRAMYVAGHIAPGKGVGSIQDWARLEEKLQAPVKNIALALS